MKPWRTPLLVGPGRGPQDIPNKYRQYPRCIWSWLFFGATIFPMNIGIFIIIHKRYLHNYIYIYTHTYSLGEKNGHTFHFISWGSLFSHSPKPYVCLYRLSWHLPRLRHFPNVGIGDDPFSDPCELGTPYAPFDSKMPRISCIICDKNRRSAFGS